MIVMRWSTPILSVLLAACPALVQAQGQAVIPYRVAVETSSLAPAACDGDWAPAINALIRANRDPAEPVPLKLGMVQTIEFGASCEEYFVASPIHGFGVQLTSVSPRARIKCGAFDGPCIWGHFPTTGLGPGSYRGADAFEGVGGRLIVRELVVEGSNHPGSVGLAPRWGFVAYDVHVSKFDTGISIECDARDSSGPANCNDWRMDMVTSSGNLGDGIRITGGDANTGVATATLVQSNGGYGLFDDALIGNTFLGVHAAYNALGAVFVKPDGQSSTMVVNAYVEQAAAPQQDIVAEAPAMVLGAMGGTFSPATNALRGTRFYGCWRVTAAGVERLRLGCDADTYLTLVDDTPFPTRLKRFAGLGIGWDWANLGFARGPLLVTGESPAELPRGRLWFLSPFLVGDTGAQVFSVTGVETLPDPAALPLGSRALNALPRPGEPSEWVVKTSTDGVDWFPL